MKGSVWSGDVYELEEIPSVDEVGDAGDETLQGRLVELDEESLGLGMFEMSELGEPGEPVSRRRDEVVSARLLGFHGEFVERADAAWLMRMGVTPEESLVDVAPSSAERIVRVAASAVQGLCGAASGEGLARVMALSGGSFMCAVRDGQNVALQRHPRKNLGFVIGAFEEMGIATARSTQLGGVRTEVFGQLARRSELEKAMKCSMTEMVACEGVGLMWPSGDGMWLTCEGEREAAGALERMSAAWLGSGITALEQLMSDQELEVIVVYETERLIFAVKESGKPEVFMASCRRATNVGMAMAKARRAASRAYEAL